MKLLLHAFPSTGHPQLRSVRSADTRIGAGRRRLPAVASTGVAQSDERIRKLYRSYVLEHDARRVFRHRGKSPRQAAFFFRNSELNFQSAQLASLYVMYGLLRGTTRSTSRAAPCAAVCGCTTCSQSAAPPA